MCTREPGKDRQGYELATPCRGTARCWMAWCIVACTFATIPSGCEANPSNKTSMLQFAFELGSLLWQYLNRVNVQACRRRA